jgi:hypothetical protein
MSSELCSLGHRYTEGNRMTTWEDNTRSCEICNRRNKREAHLRRRIC